MSLLKQLIPTILLCVVTGSIVYIAVEREHKKIGVVDAVKLFNQFHMKKELEEQAKGKLDLISKRADSIGNRLQVVRATKNEQETVQLTNALNYLTQVMEAEYTKSNEEINTQVWKRLNPIISNYGKIKKMHLIVGANGMGSVLYMDDHYDVTDDLVRFVNKKYEEGN